LIYCRNIPPDIEELKEPLLKDEKMEGGRILVTHIDLSEEKGTH
jgi:hypothetical protein